MLSNEKGISQQTFSEVFKRYYRPVCYFVLQLTNDIQQAEDITSECFQKVWVSRMNFHELPSIKAFLYKAAKNAALNYLKSLKVRSIAHDEILYLSEHTEDFILAKIMKAQLLSHIYHKVEELPHKTRVVFNLVYLDGLSTKEISEKLNTSEQNVRNAKSRALHSIKKSLAHKGLV
ncbi:RNA polymerase sigma factor [Parapedobacter sp. 10938]|uniref:RNA polymerase sigma factor n=1 Tax=Parapedobacter flavus TaxID=3110225 RepID=UPI002DBCDF3A|nr:RNA polymerase sigma-70 factor [Parapedobacter sp. 10938]MEC3880457.1 RNA polymerase sigma-70 factor [Parapedobacter sp. 10938]